MNEDYQDQCRLQTATEQVWDQPISVGFADQLRYQSQIRRDPWYDAMLASGQLLVYLEPSIVVSVFSLRLQSPTR